MKQSKRVLITGASRGIGRAIAERFAKEDYILLLHANQSAEEVQALANRLGATAFLADFSKPEEVLRLANAIGDVDILINNAGVSFHELLQDCDDAQIRSLFEVNLFAPISLCRELIPTMIQKQSGAIVNVSSVWGQTGASMETIYSSAKSGLIGFTKALAKELAPSRIRVNAVCPGVIDTDMMASFSSDDISLLCEEIPLGRLGTPEEIAESVYFLASDAASYVTGQILAPNGGFLI